MLVVVETHPIQYHAPVYRAVQEMFGLPTTVIYGSDFSIAGGFDREFGKQITWDTDLLSGYSSRFLSRIAQGGAKNASEVKARGLNAILQELNPKALMIVGYSPFFHQAAIAIGLRRKLPILFRGETNDAAGVRTRGRLFVRTLALKWLYSKFSAFLYLGKRSHEHYLRHGCAQEKMFFSPYAVDTSNLGQHKTVAEREKMRKSLGITPDKKVVLFSGKLYPAKGPGVLLEALSLLPAETRKGVEMIFVGDGEMRGELELKAQALRESKVHFVGFHNQSGIGKFYAASDLLVLPSFSETWGLVVNEALYCGLPCVVTDRVGCGPDLIQPGLTGEICEARSAQGLAAALERALCLTGRPEIVNNCNKTAAIYSIAAAAKGIYEGYCSVQESHSQSLN